MNTFGNPEAPNLIKVNTRRAPEASNHVKINTCGAPEAPNHVKVNIFLELQKLENISMYWSTISENGTYDKQQKATCEDKRLTGYECTCELLPSALSPFPCCLCHRFPIQVPAPTTLPMSHGTTPAPTSVPTLPPSLLFAFAGLYVKFGLENVILLSKVARS